MCRDHGRVRALIWLQLNGHIFLDGTYCLLGGTIPAFFKVVHPALLYFSLRDNHET